MVCDVLKTLVMLRQLVIAVTLVVAVCSASAPPLARACSLAMPTAQTALCTDCCAKLKSCVLPQQNQTPPAAPGSSVQQSIALIAPAIQSLSLMPVLTLPRPDHSRADIRAGSPPRLAVLCTFLI